MNDLLKSSSKQNRTKKKSASFVQVPKFRSVYFKRLRVNPLTGEFILDHRIWGHVEKNEEGEAFLVFDSFFKGFFERGIYLDVYGGIRLYKSELDKILYYVLENSGFV